MKLEVSVPVASTNTSEAKLRLRTRRSYRPRDLTANAPVDMLDQYLRQHVRRADEELAAAHADADDVRVSQQRLRRADVEGTVSWEALKEELDL